MAPVEILTKEQLTRINMSFRDSMVEYKYSLPEETSPKPKIYLDPFSNFFANLGKEFKKSGDWMTSSIEIIGQWVQNQFDVIICLLLMLVCIYIIFRCFKCIFCCISSSSKRTKQSQTESHNNKILITDEKNTLDTVP